MQNTLKPPEFNDIKGAEAYIKTLPPGKPKLAFTIAQLVMQAIENTEKTTKKPRKKKAS